MAKQSEVEELENRLEELEKILDQKDAALTEAKKGLEKITKINVLTYKPTPGKPGFLKGFKESQKIAQSTLQATFYKEFGVRVG